MIAASATQSNHNLPENMVLNIIKHHKLLNVFPQMCIRDSLNEQERNGRCLPVQRGRPAYEKDSHAKRRVNRVDVYKRQGINSPL